MSVFDDLVGQAPVVELLTGATAAAADVVAGRPGPAMTHAWLFTGPPGSGRSVAARAFAAALQCPRGGCGECHECRTTLAGSHADVELVRPEGLSYGVKEARALVARAALAPSGSRWQVTIVEDADRLTEGALNVLLKSIEEPPPRAVWMLCAPSADDLLPTIRSRCRLVSLRIPPPAAVAEVLMRRDGVDQAMAAFAARAAAGHVGRARRLALDEEARRRRRDVLDTVTSVGSVPAAMVAAANLVSAADEEAQAQLAPLDEAEAAALRVALGESGGKGPRPRGSAGALRDLEQRQKSRGTRGHRDALDRALDDLASFYRDVLVTQLGGAEGDPGSPAVPTQNADVAPAIRSLARSSSPEATLRRIEAVLACREAIGANVAPLLAVEAMSLALHAG